MGPDVEDKEQQQAKHSIWSSAVLGSKSGKGLTSERAGRGLDHAGSAPRAIPRRERCLGASYQSDDETLTLTGNLT